MQKLTKEQQAVKAAVLKEVAEWLGITTPRSFMLLKTCHVARMLNASRKTLARLRKSGELPAHLVRGSYRYRYADILEYLEKQSSPRIK